MSNCVNINSIEHLSQEATLLLHYTITCTGTWGLTQLHTAYRNICDTEWTVMYPNDQHPRHTDFPISVVSAGFNATFAWNYQGIRGISSENFDSNHSYLVQLGLYNLECANTGQSGGGGGGGNTGQTGQTGTATGTTSYRLFPPPRRYDPVPPVPPYAPPTAVPVPPGVILPDPPGNVNPKQPYNEPGRREDPIITVAGGTPFNLETIRSNVSPGLPFNPEPNIHSKADPVNPFGTIGGGTISRWDPINIAGFNIPGGGINITSVSNGSFGLESIRVTIDPTRSLDPLLGGSITNTRVTNFPLQRSPQVISESERIDPSQIPGIITSIGTNTSYILSDNTTTNSSEPITSVPMDNILIGSITSVQVGSNTILQGSRIVISSLFRPPENVNIDATLEVFILTDTGQRIRVLNTEVLSSTHNNPIVLAGSINSYEYRDHAYVLCLAKDIGGRVIGLDSKLVTILSHKSFIENKQSISNNSLPMSILSYGNFVKDRYISLWLSKKAEILVSPVVVGQTETLNVLVVASDSSTYSLGIEDMDTDPSALLSESTSRFRIGAEHVFPESNNGFVSSPSRDGTLSKITISPKIGNTTDSLVHIYLSKMFKLREKSCSITNYNGSTADIVVTLPYANQDIKVIINGREKGKYTTSTTYVVGKTNTSGIVTLTNVSIARGDWISVILKQREAYTISNPVYEVQF